jgi:hypothetical protein
MDIIMLLKEEVAWSVPRARSPAVIDVRVPDATLATTTPWLEVCASCVELARRQLLTEEHVTAAMMDFTTRLLVAVVRLARQGASQM